MTQKEALALLKLGKNIFLTGSAGSGKTHLLNEYIAYLRKNNVEVAITASTGIAATHLGGTTIHAWSGLGIRDDLSDWDIEELEERRYLFDRFERTKVLIIDEVSMLHHFRLDLVDRVLRSFKRTDLPFGGIQVILCGDFFQLPPVSRMGEREGYFIYRAESWRRLAPTICYLHEQHRQNDDGYLEVLNAIRENRVSEDTIELLETRRGKKSDLPIEPTNLYTHNKDVDTENERELSALPGTFHTFSMTSRGSAGLVESLKKSCLAPTELRLKKGARVMFVKNNFEEGYVNGTLGTVVDFENWGPIVETVQGKRIIASPMEWRIEEDGKVKAELSQVPLRLAWSITVHKSQGMSLDAAAIDLSKSFEPGMGYVALSRVRSLEGLTLLGLNAQALSVREDILAFNEELLELSEDAQNELESMSEEELSRFQREYIASIAGTSTVKEKKTPTHLETKKLLGEKLSLKAMAGKRGMTEGTILAHLEKLGEEGLISGRDIAHLKPNATRFAKMKKAFETVEEETGDRKLSPVRDILGSSFNFEELRLARLFLPRS